jgi:small subunit ribosomal protein S20
MPLIKQAIKKLRHDRKRTQQNQKSRSTVDQFVKKARKGPSDKSLSAAFAALDKAVKHRLIHKNKAARTKSRLSKLLKK